MLEKNRNLRINFDCQLQVKADKEAGGDHSLLLINFDSSISQESLNEVRRNFSRDVTLNEVVKTVVYRGRVEEDSWG